MDMQGSAANEDKLGGQLWDEEDKLGGQLWDEEPQRERERERTPIYLQQLIKSQLCLQHSLHQECQLQEILGNTKCEQQEDQFHPICIAILSTGNLRRWVRDEN